MLSAALLLWASALAASPSAAADIDLAFVSIRTGDAHIWVRDREGRERQLTQDRSVHVQPSVAADGRIAFVGREAGRTVIMLIGIDGAPAKRLTESNHLESGPAWSPDGRQLAYFQQDVAGDSSSLRIVDLESGQAISIPGPGERLGPLPPVWSADGSRLLFLGSDAQRRNHVWVVERDGSGLRNVSQPHSPRGSHWADLSPDGRFVAWVAERASPGKQIVVTDLHTGEARPLLDELQGSHEAPRWSPDGRQLVFSSMLNDQTSQRSDVFVVRADGSGLRNLSNHPAEDFDARWSPDGQRIVFASLRNGGSLLVQAELATGLVRSLTVHSSHDMEHIFRPRR